MLKACLDSNVWLSGLVFSGAPAAVIDLALKKKFQLVLSNFILDEVERNLVHKFGANPKTASKLRYRIAQIADVYETRGIINEIEAKKSDNLILETALMGNAKYLVTGDTKHLLPLKFFHNIKIITPSDFLKHIKN